MHLNALASILVLGSTLAVGAQTAPSKATDSPPSAPPQRVSFRNSSIDLKRVDEAIERKAQAAQSTESEVQKLQEERASLKTEVEYSQGKLQAARRRMEVMSAANSLSEVDRWRQEVQTWEGRLKEKESQLKALEDEISSLTSTNNVTASSTGTDTVLPGETLEIFVVEDSAFNGRYQVRRGGYVVIPQVGRVSVAGKDLQGSEKAVAQALEKNQLQRATVMIEKVEGADIKNGPLIYLAGEFKSPRPFRIQPGVSPTLVNVILSAGGFTPNADLTRVKVMRVAGHKGVVEEFDVSRMLDGEGLGSDITLDDGDTVILPRGSANQIYFTGKVKEVGVQPFNPGEKLTVYEAILRRGGFARFANLKKVYVLRSSEDGTKTRIPVDVHGIQKGTKPDLLLEGNDIIVVPEKFFSF